MKISLAKDQGYYLLPYTDTLPERSPLKTSLNNLQMLLEKSKNLHLEGQAYWSNGMAKGRIGKLSHKRLPQKKNYREYHQGLSEEQNTKTIPVH